jgi:hypothetical protein
VDVQVHKVLRTLSLALWERVRVRAALGYFERLAKRVVFVPPGSNVV